jgi:dephospho-CoA kinase
VYFLLPSFGDVDLVICVTAAEDARRDRLAASGRLDADAASARIAAQRPMLRDWERSDIVLRNDGELADLERAVRHIYLDRIR